MCSEYSAESCYLVKNGRRAPHPVLRIRILLTVRVESSTFFFTLASLDALVALSSAKILRGMGGFPFGSGMLIAIMFYTCPFSFKMRITFVLPL